MARNALNTGMVGRCASSGSPRAVSPNRAFAGTRLPPVVRRECSGRPVGWRLIVLDSAITLLLLGLSALNRPATGIIAIALATIIIAVMPSSPVRADHCEVIGCWRECRPVADERSQ